MYRGPRKKDEFGLTQIERRFADEYLIDLNASAAAKRSGMSEKASAKGGWSMLQKAEVQAYVHRRMEERSKRTKLTQDDVLLELKHLALSPGTPEASRVRALEIIGKHLGMFSQARLLAAPPVDRNLSEMGDDDLEREQRRLLRELGQGSEEKAPGGDREGKAKAGTGRTVRNLRPN